MENLDGYLKNVIFGGFVHQNICVHLSLFFKSNCNCLWGQGDEASRGWRLERKQRIIYFWL